MSKVTSFFKTIGKGFKEIFTGKSDNRIQDVKIEKISFINSFKIFKGIQLPWLWLALDLIVVIAHAILSFEIVTFSASIIDASGKVPTSELLNYITNGCIVGALMVSNAVLQAYIIQKIDHCMRSKLWDKLLKLRQKEMSLEGEQLVSRVTSDCNQASQYFTILISIVAHLVQLIYYIIGMYTLDITMSNFVMIFVPVSAAIGLFISWAQYRVAVKKQGFLALSTAYLVERTKDLALVKTCNTQQKEIEIGNDYFQRQYAVQVKTGFIDLAVSSVDKILNILAIILPFVVGATLFAKGEITIGLIVVFNTLVNEAKALFNQMITKMGTLKNANGGIMRISKILGYQEEALNEGIPAPENVEDILFENVEFGYLEDKNILKSVSFKIPKNKVTAVLGRNGSGKTTAFKLIERLYDVNGGAIKFGNDNINEYTLNSWRNKVCLIAQGGELMSGTLRSNICYGRDDVSEEEFQQAVQLAHVSDFAKDLPLGYDSPVLSDGSNYSGGQRQCIAIARAMLSKKPYLLLDEATCNLDAKREHDIIDALENLMQNRTTVIIAHSLGTIKHADHVVILDNGQVESTGIPSDILNKTDNYLAKMMQRANA